MRSLQLCKLTMYGPFNPFMEEDVCICEFVDIYIYANICVYIYICIYVYVVFIFFFLKEIIG